MVHAGVVPQWSAAEVLEYAGEVERALQADPQPLFDAMYGNKPDCWSADLEGGDRLRFIINVLTRLRFCRPDGQIDLKMKGAPGSQEAGWMPWFEVPTRRSRNVRLVTGHWSTLGLVDRADLLALDTGCVWGGALSAASLDGAERWSQPCATKGKMPISGKE
jgi:bis(5'-nucleosyl)-tetraphosphatase (symmetrical)